MALQSTVLPFGVGCVANGVWKCNFLDCITEGAADRLIVPTKEKIHSIRSIMTWPNTYIL